MKRILVPCIPLFLLLSMIVTSCGAAAAVEAEAPPAESGAEAPADEQAVQAQPEQEPAQDQPQPAIELVIGYADEENNMTPQKLEDLRRACGELGMQCVQGEGIEELTEQGVDAIIAFSSTWHAQGAHPRIQAAADQQIPVFVLDGECDVQGAYNLSILSEATRVSLEWMIEQMGGTGKMVYAFIGPDNAERAMVDEMLQEHAGITASALPADYEANALTLERIAALAAEQPELGAIWSNDFLGNIFWGTNDLQGQGYPLLRCESRQDGLQAWQDRLAADPSFQCIATIPPGGTAYEAVYAAYYLLNGVQIDPAALGGSNGNSLLYDFPVITNENLEEWLGKLDELRKGDYDMLRFNSMTPEQIREKWFLE